MGLEENKFSRECEIRDTSDDKEARIAGEILELGN